MARLAVERMPGVISDVLKDERHLAARAAPDLAAWLERLEEEFRDSELWP